MNNDMVGCLAPRAKSLLSALSAKGGHYCG